MILCDSNIASALLRRSDVIDAMRPRLQVAILAVSIVTVAEMFAGARRAAWGERRMGQLDAHLSSFVQVGLDRATAEMWAGLSARTLSRGRSISHNDLWIAATALQYGYVVASLDNDFEHIPSIRLLDGAGTERKNPDE